MTQPGSRHRNPVAAHPVTSTAIGILFAVSIFFVLYTPIYSRVTPKFGPWPFFYVYLLLAMPATSILLWIAVRLQKRLSRPGGGSGVAS